MKQALVEQDMYRQQKSGHLEGPDYTIAKRKKIQIQQRNADLLIIYDNKRIPLINSRILHSFTLRKSFL